MIVASVQRALRILEVAAASEQGARLADITREMDVPKSTASNILRTLEANGMLRRDPDSGRYRIGIKALLLGNAYFHKFDIRREAYPAMKALVEAIDETVHLSVFVDDSVYIVETVGCDTRQHLWSDTPYGRPRPVHCTGIGKVLLAHLSDERLHGILATSELRARTPRTMTSAEIVEQNIHETRRRGFAVDDEEYDLGVRCVAVPIYDMERAPYGALSVSAPSARLPDAQLAKTADRLKVASREISERLGWVPGEEERGEVMPPATESIG